MFFFFFNTYLAASDLHCSTWDLHCSMWNSVVLVPRLSYPAVCGTLVPLTRDQTCIPCIERWILNHWTTREVRFRKCSSPEGWNLTSVNLVPYRRGSREILCPLAM